MKKFILLLGGTATGFFNGLLGAGGGNLAVPTLVSLGLDRKSAHANSVAIIMPLSVFSATLYLVSGRVTLSSALPFIPFGMIGAAVGVFLLHKIPENWLKITFSGFMIWAGFRILLK